MPTLFISHSSADKEVVDKLVHDLLASDIGVWAAPREIKVGDDIFERLNEGLQESDYLGIVLTRHSVQSEWVKAELSTGSVGRTNRNRWRVNSGHLAAVLIAKNRIGEAHFVVRIVVGEHGPTLG